MKRILGDTKKNSKRKRKDNDDDDNDDTEQSLGIRKKINKKKNKFR